MNHYALIAHLKPLYAFEDENKLNKICELLENTALNLRGKANPDLQLSASAVVFEGEKLYFIEHPYQKELLLPAGHVEKEESPLEAAIREFHEETGCFVEAMGRLVDVNLISIPFNEAKNEQAHLHIDFRYLLKKKDVGCDQAELPFFLLSELEAPEEFKKYFKYHHCHRINED